MLTRATVLFWSLLALLWSPFAIGVERIEACDCDALSEFVAAAEQRSMASVVPLLEGTEQVLVVNPYSGTSKLFQVNRWRDPAFEPDMELVSAGMAANGRELVEVVSQHFRADALEVPLPASDRRQIEEGMALARSFIDEVTAGVSTQAIGLRLDSASALLGPYDSPAGLNRNRLKNGLSSHFAELFLSMTGQDYDLAQRVADTVVIEFTLSPAASLVAHFPDGSHVTVQILQWLVGLAGSRSLRSELLLDTVQLP